MWEFLFIFSCFFFTGKYNDAKKVHTDSVGKQFLVLIFTRRALDCWILEKTLPERAYNVNYKSAKNCGFHAVEFGARTKTVFPLYVFKFRILFFLLSLLYLFLSNDSTAFEWNESNLFQFNKFGFWRNLCAISASHSAPKQKKTAMNMKWELWRSGWRHQNLLYVHQFQTRLTCSISYRQINQISSLFLIDAFTDSDQWHLAFGKGKFDLYHFQYKIFTQSWPI